MSNALKNPPESMADREIVLTRTFDAPRELVWEAMTNPKHVVNWWGPRGFSTTIEEMDVRVGGRWKHVMHGPDGTDYPNDGIFTEAVKPERISYQHGGGCEGRSAVSFVATWTFEETEPGRTKLTLRQVYPSAEMRDTIVREYGAIEGGKQTFGRLSEFLAGTPVTVERTFKAPVALVWQAITQAEHMRQWFFDTIPAFSPEVGFATEFIFAGGDCDKKFVHQWLVTEVVPERKLVLDWKYKGYPGLSRLSIELTPAGETTRLRLVHAGLETLEPSSNPDFMRSNFVKGWSFFIDTSLKGFLEEKTPLANRTFEISRTFDAPRERLWQMWTEAEHMTQWWGPKDFTNPVCELDVRPGGKYRVVMRSPEGKEYPCAGVYTEVTRPAKLVMTMDCAGHPEEWWDQFDPNRDKTKTPRLEFIQTVTFEEVGGRTKLTVRTNMETPGILVAMLRMGMTEGWTQSLERLAESVAGAG